MREFLREAMYKDNFDLMLRRQGWYDFHYKQVYSDPNVIGQRWQVSPSGTNYSPTAFYDAFGDNTFRKLLRAIFANPRTFEELRQICSNKDKLNGHLTFMMEQETIEKENNKWQRTLQYELFEGIGPTLEWYVAEWFRSTLKVPARHGVTIKGLADGGDLDVVTFIDGIRIFVECKSGNPSNIDETQLNLFLQRAVDFGPEIAILLIDTESSIERPIEIINRIRKEQGGDPLSEQDQLRGLYWCPRNIYITNVRHSITESLAAILRLYHTKIKYLLIM